MAHILLVEDETLIAMMFQDALEAAGHRVTLAADGAEGLDADARDPADAVVTDFRMPRMDGGEMLSRLRARRPGLPAVVVTGYAGEGGIGGPATAVLTKPVSPGDIVRRLSGLLDDAATARGF